MVGTSQRGLTILYATEAAARMIFYYKKPQITRISQISLPTWINNLCNPRNPWLY